MAKPNFQTGHSPTGGAADESSVENGEASRRTPQVTGGEGGPGQKPAKTDWDVPPARKNAPMNRMLGFLMLFVVVGMFGFIAYKKMKEANFHFDLASLTSSEDSKGSKSENSATTATTSPTPIADSNAPVAANTSATANTPLASDSGMASNSSAAAGDPFGSNEPTGASTTSPASSPLASADKGSGTAPMGAVKTASAGTTETNPFNDLNEPSMHKTVPEPKAIASVGQGNQEAQGLLLDESTQPSGGSRHKKLSPAATETGAAGPNSANTKPADPMGDSFNPIAENPKPAAAINKVTSGAPAPPESSPTKDIASSGDSADLPGQKEPGSGTAGHEPASVATLDSDVSTSQPQANTRPPDASNRTAVSKTKVHSSSAKTFNPLDDSFADSPPAASDSEQRSLKPTSKSTMRDERGRDFAASEAGDYYVVQPQDNFWTISRKKYGTSRYFMALAELNKTKVPDAHRLRPGIKVSTPPTDFLETNLHQFLPKGSTLQVTAEVEPRKKGGSAGFFIGAGGRPMYRTGEKDTLSNVAARHLGRSSRWIQLFEMNRDKLPNPNQLKVGTELALPGDASNVAVSTDVDDRR